MRLMCILAVSLILAAPAFAKEREVNPVHVIDRNYKITIVMDCDWNTTDMSKTTVFAYYDNSTPEGMQVDLTLPTMTAFGMDLMLEFTADMMVYNGMPIKRLVVDYVPIPGKRCATGFSPGMMTR